MTKLLTVHGRSRAQLRGISIVPLLTPATAAGEIDETALVRLVEHVIAGGTQGIMFCGTTGEFASLTVAQRVRIGHLVTAAVRGRALLFGGIGDTCPAHSVTLAREFLAAGADAVVANLPSYYPLTPEMMEAYFSRLADAAGGPMYLYNIPQTTKQSIPLDVVERLSLHPRIAGIKDSEPDGTRQEELARRFLGRADFAVVCGSVALASRAMRAGADGFVPGGGNFAPSLMRELMDRLVAGDPAADAVQRRIDAVNATYQKGRTISQLFAALKGILEIKGLCGRHVFPPLLPVSDEELGIIRRELAVAEAMV
ncbi:MAG: dihydrodipicolinate synthase family protein [Opitutaceae bacterium]|nr:dihydrodipicolinate synthase family protein [Opitutaceae bacterium]